MNRVFGIIGIVVMLAFIACESGSSSKAYKIDNPNLREVVIKEVLHTSSYTYVKMKEEGDVYWGAVTRDDDIEVGDVYYYDNFMNMENFQSKELDRTFDNVYFIQVFSDKPFAAATAMKNDKKGTPMVGDMEVENIEPVEGGITVADLYKSKSDYEGKTVKIRGQVVKYTAAVMGKNWIHLQDGTINGKNFDITITTADIVEPGNIATFEGVVVLNKDFGYGYAYDILIEDAKLLEKVESVPM